MVALSQHRWLVLGLLGLLAPALAIERVTSVVEGRLETASALHEVRVVLNDGEYTSIPRQDGSFVFHAVMPGSYLLEVHDVHSLWPTVRLDVSAKSSGKVRAVLSHNKNALPMPIALEPLVAKPTHFEAMPKMMANMDPEQLKELQETLMDMLNPEKIKEKAEKQQKALKEGKKRKD